MDLGQGICGLTFSKKTFSKNLPRISKEFTIVINLTPSNVFGLKRSRYAPDEWLQVTTCEYKSDYDLNAAIMNEKNIYFIESNSNC